MAEIKKEEYLATQLSDLNATGQVDFHDPIPQTLK